MEQNFQTSFIPKKPMIKDHTVSAQPIGLILIISLFILFLVLLATGGIYFYKGVLVKRITNMKETLNLAESRFEPTNLSQLQVLDRRLDAADEILSKHTSIVPVFTALEKITMKSVRYTKFSYDLGAERNARVNIKLSGVAIGYRSVALQSDLFAKNENLIDAVFSNLSLDNKGNVLFDLTFSVDPGFVNYKKSLLAES